MSGPEDPWERHAAWWRETFTNGADLEYELQILPLAESHLEGAFRVLDLGSGGRPSRPAPPAGAPEREIVVGLEPSAGQLNSAVAQGGGPVYVRGVGERLPFPDGAFDAVVCCLVIEHRRTADALLAEAVKGARRRRSSFSWSITRCSKAPGVVSWTTGSSASIIGGSDRTCVREIVSEEVDPGVWLPFAHRPLRATSIPSPDSVVCLRASRSRNRL